MQGTPASNIWYQNNYRIRKKVLTIWNKYWIEDPTNNLLGFSKQKMLKLKEDIRIYTDESMNSELFAIKQEQILGLAAIDQNRCWPWAYGIPCIVCEEMCPIADKAIELETGEGQGQGRGGGGHGGGGGPNWRTVV